MTLPIIASIVAIGVASTAYLANSHHQAAPTFINVESSVLPRKLESKAELPTLVKKIQTLEVNAANTVYINGEIGSNTSEVAQKIKSLYKTASRIYVVLDSPGGSVTAGGHIISAMEASPVPVTTVCAGMCASMAYIIFQYGQERLMVDRAILMAHPASAGVQGSLEQMQSRLTLFTRYVDKFNQHIVKRVGLTTEEYHNLYMPELWLDAADALEQHFSDGYANLIEEQDGTMHILPAEDYIKEFFQINAR